MKTKENTSNPSVRRNWLDKIRAHIYRSPLYLVTLRSQQRIDLQQVPSFLKSGRRADGIGILKGQFPFAGRTYQSEVEPWSVAQDDAPWQSWIHSFKWLDDLSELESPEAIVYARSLITSWMDLHGVWTPVAWRADVMGDRLISWLVHANQLTASADVSFIEAFNKSFSKQISHLQRSYFKDLTGLQLVRALRGQLYLSLFVEGFEKNTYRSLDRLGVEFDQQVLADGGHISRNPSKLLEILQLCLQTKNLLNDQKIEVPDSLQRALDRMAPMVRTLRHGDGKLALFHGGQEGDADDIERLLEQTENLGQPLSNARHSGFQRLEAGRTVVLVDVARPPDATKSQSGHAAPLSLEVSCDEERILVNCGAVLGGDPSWQEALGATAAHNSVTVDEKNCLELIHGGGVVSREVEVTSERFEENGQILVDSSHDAYKEAMGLIHQRSVYLNKTGDDLRIEDRLIGTGGSSYAISLHLHPDVQASLVQEGQAALLKLPSGSGWHLKVQGGKLEMRESIYASNPGQMRHTDQIAIQGPLRGEGCQVKWRLSRIGS